MAHPTEAESTVSTKIEFRRPLSKEGSFDDGMEAWMLVGQDEGEGQEPAGGDDMESDFSTQSRRSVCEQDPNENEGHPDEVSDIKTDSPANNSKPQTQTVNDSHANVMPNTQAQIPTDTQGVKTRAGRLAV